MCWLNAIATAALETGPVQPAGVVVTVTGSGSENAPLARCAGPLTLSAASPAVEMTSAVVEAVYVLSIPGVNAPNDGAAPSVSESVAGTVPPTVPVVLVANGSAGAVVGSSWPLPSASA